MTTPAVPEYVGILKSTVDELKAYMKQYGALADLELFQKLHNTLPVTFKPNAQPDAKDVTPTPSN